MRLTVLILLIIFSSKRTNLNTEDLSTGYWKFDLENNEAFIKFESDYFIQFSRPAYFPNNPKALTKSFNSENVTTSENLTHDYWDVTVDGLQLSEHSFEEILVYNIGGGCSRSERYSTVSIRYKSEDSIVIIWDGNIKVECTRVQVVPFHFNVTEILELVRYQMGFTESKVLNLYEDCISDSLIYWSNLEGFNKLY